MPWDHPDDQSASGDEQWRSGRAEEEICHGGTQGVSFSDFCLKWTKSGPFVPGVDPDEEFFVVRAHDAYEQLVEDPILCRDLDDCGFVHLAQETRELREASELLLVICV